jgi:acetylornithine deacetylase/succinyl-diaminopimelate desuccinylase-like protein
MLKTLLVTGLMLCTLMVGTTSGTTPAGDEAVDILSRYLQIDTTNPPGNEKAGAEFLAEILKDNGIAPTILETAPGRACVYARLKGNGKKKALILLNHIDVVPARAQDWQQPPFSGKIVNGEIWGRGAIDMKGTAIAQLVALLQIKRSGKVLDRDIIFLATPDEEVGGDFGAEWITSKHPELVRDAEYLLNEGFFIDTTSDGKAKYWGIDVAEKSVLWLRLTATGDAGHASMPMPDSAPNRLVHALSRVINSPPAPSVLPSVQAFFENIADTEAEPLRSYYKNISRSVHDEHEYQQLLKDKLRSSMLRNTVSLTVMKAGYKTNVIPAEATAELDCRLLPGVTKEQFVREIEQKIADPAVKISVIDWVKAQPSPYDTELFRIITAVAHKSDPHMPVVPVVVPWFTDSHWFREFGTVAYGFEPFKIDPAHLATVHGKDERIQVSELKDGVERLRAIIEKLCVAE